MGYKIKEARVERKMTQEELSAKSGVSRTIIAGLESGAIKDTTTKTLLKLATALDCRVTDIFFTDKV